MKNIIRYSELRHTILLFLIIFLATGAICSGILMVFYKSEIKTKLSQLIYREKFSVNLQNKTIESTFDSVISDLMFLSNQNELREYLSSSSSHSLDKLAIEYIFFAKEKKVYDQIRFIDEQGMELVRINYDHEKALKVEDKNLLSKKSRYYFYDCFKLHQGEVYISPFDLNVEHSLIEQPLKPMIRIGTPVFDDHGRKRGIVMLNYLGSSLLSKLMDSEQISDGQTMLLNKDGYWLLSSDANMDWGFMFGDKKRSFFFKYPAAWKTIHHSENGQFFTPEGLFTFRDIFPLKNGYFSSNSAPAAPEHNHTITTCPNYHWYLVSFVPQRTLDKFSNYLTMKLFSFGAGMFIIIALGSWWLAFAITKKRIYQAQLKTLALYDVLTGLPNRRLFHDRLTAAIHHSYRYNNSFALLYIDLDGFKKINDSLGHEAGDALLCEVARKLGQAVRESDTVARMGGDEFAIIIDHLIDKNGAKMVAEKIIDMLSRPMNLPQGTSQVGASIGISLFPDNSENGNELLQQADTAMYHSKNSGTNIYSFYLAEMTSIDGEMDREV